MYDIDNYLNSTRKIKGPINSDLEKHYLSIFNILSKHINATDSVVFKTTYSANKTAELLLNKCGSNFLIYDQYLGQVFNMLNRIYFNSNEPGISDYYGLKLLAEEFQIKGELEIALVCALSYRQEISNFNSHKKDIDLKKRFNYTLIQETFVLLHELCHILFAKTMKEENHDDYRQNTIALINQSTQNYEEHHDNFFDLYLAGRHNAIYGTANSYKDFLTEEQINSLKEKDKKDFYEHNNELIKLINKDDNLIEELIVDDVATAFLLEIGKKEFGISVENILDAIYIGLMHLRVLGFINKTATNFIDNKNDLKYFINTSQIRLTRNRDKASFYYGLYMDDMANGDKIQHVLTKSNERYSSVISDKILFSLPDRLERIRKKNNNQKQDFDFEKMNKYNNHIDELIGFKV